MEQGIALLYASSASASRLQKYTHWKNYLHKIHINHSYPNYMLQLFEWTSN